MNMIRQYATLPFLEELNSILIYQLTEKHVFNL